ncbi:vitamin K epoxide reductase family protein [Synechococcus sp. CCY9202]|uniref:vitamin K epoxide reductase family protein n=1 Tax=Synechococcus sp. CCY9202 TaxID=174698 RepID=UPI002B20F797|nr:vitamin K epoxide reductase family protein [Synechococcus sp. CCY9202]MEA5424612.1 vitamin K epoxide reductase family protein [Synechococcus sp. CCY9202]
MTSSLLSSRLSSRRPSEPSRRWVWVVMAVLATVGVIDTGSITLKRWGLLGPLVCPGGAEGCDKVLNSAWGTVLGQPLSLLGFLAYSSVLVLAVLALVLRGDLRSRLLPVGRWGLFLIATGMAVFSLLLLGLMVFKIQAFCFFCLLSATLSLALCVFSLLQGGWEDRGQLLFRGVLVALVVALVGLGWAASVDRPAAVDTRGTPPAVIAASTPESIALAEHLTATGAVMYSAYWCPHCHEQKELFGKEATTKLKVIECAADGKNSQKELCDSKNLEGFPSWEIKGKLDSGVKSLEQLKLISGFSN